SRSSPCARASAASTRSRTSSRSKASAARRSKSCAPSSASIHYPPRKTQARHRTSSSHPRPGREAKNPNSLLRALVSSWFLSPFSSARCRRDRGAEATDERRDHVATELVRRAIGDEDARDLRDLFAFFEAVLHQRRAGLHQVDDELREAGERRELDGALHVDDLRLLTAAREMRRGGARILRRDAGEAA